MLNSTKKHCLSGFTSTGAAMSMQNGPSILMLTLTVSFLLHGTPAIGAKYTHRAANGYYCASDYISNYTAIEHQRCVAHCITNPYCWVLAYNSRGKYCLLGTHPCVTAEVDNDFRMMAFRKHEYLCCIQWVWSDGSSYPNRTVEQVRPKYQAVARRPIDGEIYIGRSNPGSGNIYVARNDKATNYPDYYLLVVSEACSVAWVPYTAGNALPRGAVEAGYLNSLGGTYCMRAGHKRYFYGYYAPSNGLGYYAWYGSKTTTQMDILVQVHLSYWITEAGIDINMH